MPGSTWQLPSQVKVCQVTLRMQDGHSETLRNPLDTGHGLGCHIPPYLERMWPCELSGAILKKEVHIIAKGNNYNALNEEKMHAVS